MQKIPECRSMNFSIYEGMLNRYKDSEDIRKSYESRGLNGLEVIRAGEPDEGKILPDMVNGVHLYFHIFWMDWWKGNYERLDQEFKRAVAGILWRNEQGILSEQFAGRSCLCRTSWSKVCSFPCFRSDTPGELYL